VSLGSARRLSSAVRRTALPGAVCVVAALLMSPTPSLADPASPGSPAEPSGRETIPQVQAQLDRLHHDAEIASESLNTVREEMGDTRERLRSLQADVRRQEARVGALRSQVVSTAVADYQSNSTLSTSASFLLADDPQSFLTGLANSAVTQDQQSNLLEQLTVEQRLLEVQQGQADTELEAITADAKRLQRHKAELDDKTDDAQEVLADLKAEQRRRLLAAQERAEEQAAEDALSDVSRTQSRLPTSTSTSDRAAIAVETALAQVGEPYVYGAAGPDAFDCSGLTMYAWAAAGVSIPHSSGLQPSAGTPVSLSALSPGDLIFYYSPISHVGMYIGNGQIVHASNPSSPISVVDMNLMPIATAVHIG